MVSRMTVSVTVPARVTGRRAMRTSSVAFRTPFTDRTTRGSRSESWYSCVPGTPSSTAGRPGALVGVHAARIARDAAASSAALGRVRVDGS